MDGETISAAASTIAALLAILLAFAAAAYALRRFRTLLPGAVTNNAAISIIATRPLGGQNALIITEAEGVRFLIASSRSGITAIGRLTPPEPGA